MRTLESSGRWVMLARVLRVEVGSERIDAIVTRYRETVRPIHEQAAGLRKHYVLVDRAV